MNKSALVWVLIALAVFLGYRYYKAKGMPVFGGSQVPTGAAS